MNVSVRFAHPEDQTALMHIWQVCFGDDLSYISFFMKHCFCPENTVVACLDNTVVGVTYMLPATLAEHKFLYGYAVGVLPDYRGNNICEIMHEFIKEYAERNGFVYGLHPANEKLFSFYRRIGLRDMYSLRNYDAPKSSSATEYVVKDTDAKEYISLRKKAFDPLVEWGPDMIKYIISEANAYGGFAKKIIIDGNERILYGKQYENHVYIKETTMTDDEILRTTPFLYEYFNAEHITFALSNRSSLGTEVETVLGFGAQDSRIYMNLFLD